MQCCQTSGQNPKTVCKKSTQAILTQSLLACENGQHIEWCLLLSTIACVDNMSVCMLSMLADIVPCSPVENCRSDNTDDLQG